MIERRYYAGLANLREIFLPIVDTWVIVDNSRGENEIVATNNTVYNPEKLSKILSE